METINDVNTFTKDGKTKVVINNKHFLSAGYVSKLTGMNGMYHLLKGSSVRTEYYKTGEDMGDGVACTKDDTIVKEAEFELSPQLMSFSMAAAFGTIVSVK